MLKRQFLETAKGQWHRWRARQDSEVFALAKQEPRSKGSITQDEKIAFQSEVAQALGRRRAFRAGVVLELAFVVGGANPPAIHTLAKNYLDLLMRPERGSAMRRQRLLYNDDRQVKFLVVTYQIAEGTRQARIDLHARPLRHLLEDLRLLSDVRKRASLVNPSGSNFAQRDLT